MSDTPDVIHVTREELLAQRQAVLTRLGITLADLVRAEGECSCCPPNSIEMSWSDWNQLCDIKWLLGDEPVTPTDKD